MAFIGRTAIHTIRKTGGGGVVAAAQKKGCLRMNIYKQKQEELIVICLNLFCVHGLF